MPLTTITVIYGSGQLVDLDGDPCVGTITLSAVQETPSSTDTIVGSDAVLTVTHGQIVAGSIKTNGQPGLQVAVYERLANTRNPAPYIVNIPTSGTLDLSTASRAPAG